MIRSRMDGTLPRSLTPYVSGKPIPAFTGNLEAMTS